MQVSLGSDDGNILFVGKPTNKINFIEVIGLQSTLKLIRKKKMLKCDPLEGKMLLKYAIGNGITF